MCTYIFHILLYVRIYYVYYVYYVHYVYNIYFVYYVYYRYDMYIIYVHYKTLNHLKFQLLPASPNTLLFLDTLFQSREDNVCITFHSFSIVVLTII